MDREKARSIYRSGEEPTVEKLMALDDENERLKKENAALKTNSTNSSKPPSTDGPSVPRPVKQKGFRKPGGQPGHKGHQRVLLPPEAMTHIIELHPERCCQCGRPLNGTLECGEPVRKQTFELPEIEMIKTEYRCYVHQCECGCKTRASVPEHVEKSQFGSNIHALVLYLVSARKMSRRDVSEMLSSIMNLEISVGAIDEMLMRASEAMKPVVDDLVDRIREQDRINIDETGWKTQKSLRWVWGFICTLFTVFKVSPSRGSQVLESMLGESYPGIITSDDYSAYNKYVKKEAWQLCWAHQIRKFNAMVGGEPEAKTFGEKMLKLSGQLFSYWHLYQEEGIEKELWQNRADAIQAEIKQLCIENENSSNKTVRTRARKTIEKLTMLFTFVREPNIEPTNNAAERALRHAVITRKISFGSKSEKGERFIERAFTIKETCRQQNKNHFEYLTRLMSAYFNKQPFPALA